MPRSYVKFEEIEDELSIKAPKIVYKYRTWTDDNHKSLLRDRAAWFSHPFDLNDPLDVRPETVFNIAEIHDTRYLEKMINSASHMNTERERRIVAERKWEEFKSNPDTLIVNHTNWNKKRENFDRYGVFSTAMNDLNDKLWDEYSAHYSGYCLGFNTVELCREINSGFGYVQYDDQPYQYSFLDKKDDGLDILYLKKEVWRPENEFRFITVGIGVHSKRLQGFKPETASELILGYNVPNDQINEILEIVKNKYPSGFPAFRLGRDNKNQLTKSQIL